MSDTGCLIQSDSGRQHLSTGGVVAQTPRCPGRHRPLVVSPGRVKRIAGIRPVLVVSGGCPQCGGRYAATVQESPHRPALASIECTDCGAVFQVRAGRTDCG